MLRYQVSAEETATALAEHAELVADEVLATDFAAGAPEWPGAFVDESLGLKFWLHKASS